jgi:hypothetical protein
MTDKKHNLVAEAFNHLGGLGAVSSLAALASHYKVGSHPDVLGKKGASLSLVHPRSHAKLVCH